MNVFIDTNAFFNNWFVGNVNFKLLFHYLNNENLDLLLSELVVQEVNNLRNREVDVSTSEIKKHFKRLHKLNSGSIGVAIEDISTSKYDIKTILEGKVHSIENIDYEGISQKEVVQRALNVTKPFTDGEKGYRDTLIWLSFLKYLKENSITGDVAFITDNKSDFFEKKGSNLVLNEDLQKDIIALEIEASIKPYLKVFDFNKENVDQITNAVNKYEILDDEEYFLIEETESYLNSMSNSELSNLLGSRVFGEKLTEVIDIKSDIFEGLEDPEVNYVSELSDSSVYISCLYEMRRVDLVVTIDLVEFKRHVDDIENIEALYNIEIDEDTVNLSFIFRLYIDASFEYDTTSEICSNLSIEQLSARS
ncbi:PIN domain-containing protein [Pseudoalteromonas obscura]|uniref:PIN domain-containing protein n=1 Tax=Pseudoalteromonas obscura TaxID=3048491 RepID=A0ABT7ETC8_9GAMM|nr:PIN domain-containing protein [Pseudoalteromonas sp. P94(2023)]MDK2598315.1 PIN domain-containing protein [Pseudoalteromonas sp. P94(2023)]